MNADHKAQLKQIAETARRAVDTLYYHLERAEVKESLLELSASAHCELCSIIAEINAITPEEYH